MSSQPLLTKDSLNIGGHKFPIALIGGLAAVAGVLLVLRARSQGSRVASVGQQPMTADLSGFGTQGFLPDQSAALANIQASLSNLSGDLQGFNKAPGSAAAVSGPAGGLASLFSGNTEELYTVDPQGQLREQWTDFNFAGHTSSQHSGILASGLTPGSAVSAYLVGQNRQVLVESPAGQITRYWYDATGRQWYQGGYQGLGTPQPFTNLS